MSFDARGTDLKTKTKDELYGWTEREYPGTPQHTAAMRELVLGKKRDNTIRVILGICIVMVLFAIAWARH
jgi:hypothetical protein